MLIESSKFKNNHMKNFRHVFKIDVESYKAGIYLVSLVVDGSVIETSKLNVLKN